jgi:hypothetical protein
MHDSVIAGDGRTYDTQVSLQALLTMPSSLGYAVKLTLLPAAILPPKAASLHQSMCFDEPAMHAARSKTLCSC